MLAGSEVAKLLELLKTRVSGQCWEVQRLQEICESLFELKMLLERNGNASSDHFADFKRFNGYECMRAVVGKLASYRDPDLKAIMKAENIFCLMTNRDRLKANKELRAKLDDCILRVADVIETVASQELYSLSMLSDDDEFLGAMMNWMERPGLFQTVSKRVEELLLTRSSLFPLEKFKKLHSLMQRVIDGDVMLEFSSLARIFTLVVYFHGSNNFEDTKKVS